MSSMIGDNPLQLRDAIQKIDDEMKAHYMALANLRLKRNTLIPINRLPPELLSKIFCAHRDRTIYWFMRSDWPDPDYGALRPEVRLKEWIQIAWVCRHWRDVALSTARIWNHIDLDRPRFSTQCSIPRSKTAPLYLTARIWDIQQTVFFASLALELNRVHSIDIDLGGNLDGRMAPATRDQESLIVSECGPVPFASLPLRTLIIMDGRMPRQKCSLRAFQQCDFPSLRDVQLVDCMFLPSSLFQPTLTTLLLGTSECFQPTSIDGSILLQSLRNMPHLCCLDIQNMKFTCPTEPSTVGVTSPELSYVTLKPSAGADVHYILLLKTISARPMGITRLTLTFHKNLKMERVPSFLASVKAYVRCISFYDMNISFTDDALEILVDSGDDPEALRLWLPIEAETSSYLWEEFFDLPGLSDLELIDLGQLQRSTFDDHWVHLLSRCTKLWIAHLTGDTVHMVISRLDRLIPNPGCEIGTIPIMPALKDLHIHHCSWRTLEEAVSLRQSGEYVDCATTRMFSRRRELGYPIDNVDFEHQDCRNIFAQDISYIQENIKGKVKYERIL